MPIHELPSAHVPVGQTQRQNALFRRITNNTINRPIHEVASRVRVVSHEATVITGLNAGINTGNREWCGWANSRKTMTTSKNARIA
jgi:peptidoglycan hydrolase-like protein with peptidoglycan-binding domain